MKIKSAASVNIGAIIDARMKEQQLRQRCLLKHLSSVHYLAQQGLAFRGHDDKGNMMQLLQMWSLNDRYQKVGKR